MERFLLDTHIWIWLLEDAPELSESSFRLLKASQAQAELYVSIMSVWELSLLVVRKRIDLHMALDRWLAFSFTGGRLKLLPLSIQAALDSNQLPGRLHKDPIDRMLVATARIEEMTLLTRDKLLLTYAAQGHLRAQKF
jgi:PIN domain nuclease of toxin-antitoxin system